LSAPAFAQDFDGLYGGFHLGGAYADFDSDVPAAPGPLDDAGSFIGGAQIGYNIQDGDTVYGVELSYSITELVGESVFGTYDQEGVLMLTGRYGQLSGPNYIYGLVGVAGTVTSVAFGGPADEETITGFTIGAGVERFYSDTMSVRGEAIFVDVPKEDFDNGVTGGSSTGLLRVGVNFHF